MIKNKLSNYISFLAISFSGAYKFIIVFLYSYFLDGDVFDKFSEQYFWLLAIWSLSGMPFSLLMNSRSFHPSFAQSVFFILLTNILLCLLAFIFITMTLNEFYVFILACLCASFYEVAKKDLLDRQQYFSIFISGFASFLMLGLFIYFCIQNVSMQNFSLFFAFFAILFPLVVFSKFKGIKRESMFFSNSNLLKKFCQYGFSNFLSTSIGFIVPILLVGYLGKKYAGEIAEINSATRILLMIPVALAAKNIPKLKTGFNISDTLGSYVLLINKFVFLSLLLSSCALFITYSDNLPYYIMMVSALLIPQLALPYSNFLAVEDKSSELLVANLIGVSALVIMISVSFLFDAEDSHVALYGMLCLNVHFLIKFYLTRHSALNCLGVCR